MAATVEASSARTSDNRKRAKTAAAARREDAVPKGEPVKPILRTVLVASHGWPTEADLPVRRGSPRR